MAIFKLKVKLFKVDILQTIFSNNVDKCAKELGILPDYLQKVLDERNPAGIETLKAIINFCQKNNINPRKYIEQR